MAVLPVGIGPVTGYQIQRSLRFNSADSAYLSRTFGTPTNQNVWTLSMWIKKTTNGTYGALFARNDEATLLEFLTTDVFTGYMSASNIGATTSVYRDNSAWYHFIFVCSSSTAQTLYINGTQVKTYTATNRFNASGITHLIGARNGPSEYFNGYMTEINFIDGQALTPSSFGETNAQTGVWQPKAYTGTYGTNGFFLKFADNTGTTSTTLGKDSSGNGNNWTPNNFSVTAGAGNDSLVDTPTPYGSGESGGDVRGNYATLNPLSTNGGTLSNGNLEYTGPSAWRASPSTILLPSTGKWYFEGTLKAAPFNNTFGALYAAIGLIAPSAVSAWSYNSGTAFFVSDTGHYSNYNTGSSGSFTGNASGTVIGLAINRDTNQVTIYQNGVSQATVTLGITSGADLYIFSGSYDVNYGQMAMNFGQRAFAYPVSTFKALCTQNLPTPTIGATSTTQAGKYMNVALYTGTGSSLSVTGVGFQPDLVWIKSRSNIQNHKFTDAVRGTTKALISNTNGAETTDTNGLTAFNSDGFTVGTDATYNTNTYTYVGWNWKANGSGSSNTSGSITSTVSANTTAGFSIVTYTGNGSSGATVGHGLGVAPNLVIIKNRSGAYNWIVYSKAVDSVGYLDLTDAFDGGARYSVTFNSTAPSSSVITLGTSVATNNSSQNFVAYCFAAVAGYSAFGSYTGNGSTDGPFVFTNHRPAFLLVKRTDSTSNWTLFDFKRAGYNVDNDQLYPNLSNAEATTDLADILSNGFKLRSTDTSVNASGGTYIYMSVAENPFKYSLAR